MIEGRDLTVALPGPEFLTFDEVGRLLRVDTRQVRRLTREPGGLPFVLLSRKVAARPPDRPRGLPRPPACGATIRGV